MDKLVITGGKRLEGTVSISGSKNATLPILAAAILAETPSEIHNVPDLVDIRTMCSLLQKLGVKIKKNGTHTLTIDPRKLHNHIAPYDLVSKMRASICVLGPLLGRLGKAQVSMPGGCVIGPRPIDLHLKGMKALGVNLDIQHGYIVADARGLKGAELFLGGRFGSSVLATANVMMAAVKAKGTTIIENAACEPEVVDLACFLGKMGARIEGVGSHTIHIHGVKELHGTTHTVIPDRIETGTYIIASIITRGNIEIKEGRIEHIRAVIDKLEEAGVKIYCKDDVIRVKTPSRLKPIEVITLPYPCFPTDMQAQIMVLMTLVPGLSIVTEKVFPERFMHVSELIRMAADLSLEGATVVVKGVGHLSGAQVMASDLRASAALVLAGLAARGTTEVHRIYHLDRGYEKMTEKLRRLGADIKRVPE